MTVFHLKDGLYFERTAAGAVHILVKDARGEIVLDTLTDPSGFASVMASVCAFGETAQTWQEAKDFLERPYPGDDGAYRRWRELNNNAQNPLCSCVGRGDDDAHKSDCSFWQFVLNLRSSWPGRNDFR